MFSIRAFTRRLPRTTPRLATYSTRSPIRPSLQTALRSNSSPSSTLRAAFSTSIARRDEHSDLLAAKLNSEINLESDNMASPTDSDGNVQAFFDTWPQWTLHSPEGEQEVRLTRKYEDEEITVSFSIVDFNSPALDDPEADDAMYDEEDALDVEGQSGGGNTKGAVNQGRTGAGNVRVAPEDRVAPGDRDELRNEEDDYADDVSSPAFATNVAVLIQRPGNERGALRINLISEAGRFTIHGVTHLGPSSAPVSDLLHNTPESLYTGPPFQQLDEDVQSLLEQYLDARGINTALAMFIPDYIDVKEQKEYMHWLGKVKNFLE